MVPSLKLGNGEESFSLNARGRSLWGVLHLAAEIAATQKKPLLTSCTWRLEIAAKQTRTCLCGFKP